MTSTALQTLALAGRSVALRSEGAGRPLLLLHGLGADSRQVVAALPAPAGWRLYAPDLPGHGGSRSAIAGFRPFADLLRALMDRLGLARAVLGGISMGAAVALRVALDAPERVAGLLLVRPAWLDRPALPHLGLVARIGSWQCERPNAAATLLDRDAEYLEIARTNPGAAQSLRGLLDRPQARESAPVLEAMVADRPLTSLDELAGVDCPALLLANEGDPLHPVAIARALANRLRRAELLEIPSRYLAPEAHLAALRAAALQFLRRLGDA